MFIKSHQKNGVSHMKNTTVLICLIVLSLPVRAEWTPFRDILYQQINTSGDVIFGLAGHRTDEANPGRCDLSMFKIKKGEIGYDALTDTINRAFYNNKKARINVINSCHDTHRYKRLGHIQVKR